MPDKYLTFRLQGETYGVPVSKVREIVPLPAITVVPQSPAYVKGVFNLRSRVLPVIDLRSRFGVPEAAYTDRTCIVVVEVAMASATVPMGVAVDAVSDVVPIASSDIEALPGFGEDAPRGVVGITTSKQRAPTMILDLDRLLGSRSDGSASDRFHG
jgi:purine-binding chemotaxis protein CheW